MVVHIRHRCPRNLHIVSTSLLRQMFIIDKTDGLKFLDGKKDCLWVLPFFGDKAIPLGISPYPAAPFRSAHAWASFSFSDICHIIPLFLTFVKNNGDYSFP